MAGFDDPAFYGDRWAEVYDERHAPLDPAAAVEFLAGLSGGGRVLELAGHRHGPPCGQRVQVAFSAPGQVTAQVGLGVVAEEP